MPTLTDLLTPRDSDAIQAILLSALQAQKDVYGNPIFPVTDWYSGGVARTILYMFAQGLLDREELIKFVASGGSLDLSAALVDANGNPVEDWCELCASWYGLARTPATSTTILLTLSSVAGTGSVTRSAGEMIAVSASGNYYFNVGSLTIPDGGSTTATFQAQSPGIVQDAAGTVTTLTTPIPGVSVVNAPTTFSPPVSQITGSGSITATGTPATSRTVRIRFSKSGTVAATSAQFYFDVWTAGSGTMVTTGPFTVAATYSQGDITFHFTDGSGGLSFIAGDTWTITTPGTPTLSSGVPQESLASLVSRCKARWPSLSAIPTETRYEAWAIQCSLENYFGINRTIAVASTDIAGLVLIYLAGADGTASPTQVTTITNYIQLRLSPIESVTVASAVAVTVTPNGDVYVPRGKTAAVTSAFTTAWMQYLSTVPIGGETLANGGNGVRFAKLEQTLMDSGAYNYSGLGLNGFSTDVALSAYQTPQFGDFTSTLYFFEVG